MGEGEGVREGEGGEKGGRDGCIGSFCPPHKAYASLWCSVTS